MADNVTTQTTVATIPDATTIATDDVAGVHYQRVKLVDGTLDATTAIAAGGGVEAGALRVTVASDSTGVLSVDDNGGSLTVDGTVTANAGSGTFAVSAASLPLPSGASTAAKQPALGTAGSASTDVITVQGIASMTALKVDGSAVTQPVSGSVSISGTPNVTLVGTTNIDAILSTVTVDGAVSPAASATVTGATPFFDSSVNNAAQTLKGTAGRLYSVEVSNPNTSDAWVQFFNATSPTVGSTTPVYVLFVPGGASSSLAGATDKAWTPPLMFSTAITYAATTTPTGSTATSSPLVMSAGYA